MLLENAEKTGDVQYANELKDLVLIPEYGWLDRIGFMLGGMYTFNKVVPQLQDFDFRKDALNLEVPVYFMIGRYDIRSNYWFAEDYFKKLQAPSKKLFISSLFL